MDVRRLVFIDETGLNTKMARLYGRAARGQRCVDHVPYGHWCSSTFIAALRHDRMDAPMVFDGPMNGDTFRAYIKEVLCPTLSKDDILICDNLPAHKVTGVAKDIQAVGANIRYLPPYSPDLNPIEMAFAKIKAFMRSQAADSLQKIIQATANALATFNKNICAKLIKHAKYQSILN